MYGKEARQRVIVLRKQGCSLNEIAEKTGFAKTTISSWVRALSLSNDAQAILDEKERLGRVKGNKSRRISLPTFGSKPAVFSPRLVRFLSHIYFDGGVYKDSVNYYSSHKTLVDAFAHDGELLLGRSAYRYVSKYQIFRASYFSKNLVDFVAGTKHKFFNEVANMSAEGKIEFLKAFFDDEGTITYIPESNKKLVRGYQKDLHVIEVVKDALLSLGIQAGIENKNFLPEVVIRGKANLMRYQKLINFSNGVSFLAKRKNSRYEKPIEKRLILKQAVTR